MNVIDGLLAVAHLTHSSVCNFYRRVASHSFTGGFAGIGKLPALFGWYIRYGIGIKLGLTNAETT